MNTPNTEATTTDKAAATTPNGVRLAFSFVTLMAQKIEFDSSVTGRRSKFWPFGLFPAHKAKQHGLTPSGYLLERML